jgi:hypothetical protein
MVNLEIAEAVMNHDASHRFDMGQLQHLQAVCLAQDDQELAAKYERRNSIVGDQRSR